MGIGGPEGFGVVRERGERSHESWLRDRRSERARREKAEPINRIHDILASKEETVMTPEERQIWELVNTVRDRLNR